MDNSNGIRLGLLPLNGDRLLSIRMKKQIPDGLVVVSFVGKQQGWDEHFTLLAKTGQEYDWRIIKGLQLCLLIKPGLVGIGKSMLDIAKEAYPGAAFCWDVERGVGCELQGMPTVDSINRPRADWRYKLDAIPWTAGQNEKWRMYGT